jgi:hypothetical protein
MCIEIMNSHENRNKRIDIKIRSNCRRNKNTNNDFGKVFAQECKEC